MSLPGAQGGLLETPPSWHRQYICMSSQQKKLVYALWQGVPKLVYAFWTCKPVRWTGPILYPKLVTWEGIICWIIHCTCKRLITKQNYKICQFYYVTLLKSRYLANPLTNLLTPSHGHTVNQVYLAPIKFGGFATF